MFGLIGFSIKVLPWSLSCSCKQMSSMIGKCSYARWPRQLIHKVGSWCQLLDGVHPGLLTGAPASGCSVWLVPLTVQLLAAKREYAKSECSEKQKAEATSPRKDIPRSGIVSLSPYAVCQSRHTANLSSRGYKNKLHLWIRCHKFILRKSTDREGVMLDHTTLTFNFSS